MIVYAGAIIVTFLFVIMLAQMEGKALYDRAARASGPATVTCFLLMWSLIYSLTAVSAPQVRGRAVAVMNANTLTRTREIPQAYYLQPLSNSGRLRPRFRTTSWIYDWKGVEKPNVAGLGESLYTDHLVTAGLTGVLLFVALVGAVAITNPKRLERSVS